MVAAAPKSPYTPILPAGERAAAPLRSLASAGGLGSLSQDSLAWVGIAAMVFAVAVFAFAIREAWRGGISVRLAVTLGIAFNLAMLLLPLLFSRDVYSYALEGRIVSIYHANPYVAVPANYPYDPVARLIGPKWIDTPSVYGPVFTLMSATLTKYVHGIADMILAYKLIAVAASIGTLGVVSRLVARVRPERAAFAAVLLGWNPVVLFHSVASGHNDMLVALAVACAIALVHARRDLLATGVLALGVLVKATAVFPLGLLILFAVARKPRGERTSTFAKLVAVAGVIGIGFSAPFEQTSDPTLGMANLATHTGWLAPSRMFHDSITHWLDRAGLPGLATVAGGLVRAAFPLAFVVSLAFIVVYVARRAGRLSSVAEGGAWAWVLLLFALTGPVLLPWYIVWMLPLAWLLPDEARNATVALAILFALSEVIAEPMRAPHLFGGVLLVVHYVITTLVFGVLVYVLADLRRRARLDLSLESMPAEIQGEVPAQAGQR